MPRNYTVNCLLDSVAKTCGEAPFWQSATKTLYFVSVMDGEVHLWSEPNAFHDKFEVGEKPGDCVSFVVPCEAGGFLAGVNQRIMHCDWVSGQMKRRVLHEVDPGEPVRLNDAKCDPLGRLVVGTMCLEKEPGVMTKPGAGSLYGLDLDGSIKRLDTGFTLGNGLAWNDDKFYFIDTISRCVYVYDWDSTGFAVANRRVAVDFSRLSGADTLGMPDGMTVDASGRLWVACLFGSRVLCLDPEQGQVVRQVDIPVPNVTSCCWGDASDLFVTTAKAFGNETSQAPKPAPHAGSVFRVTGLGPDVRGIPSMHFKGKIA